MVLVGDSCLNRYQLALTALCAIHPPSFPTDLFQADEHVDLEMSQISILRDAARRHCPHFDLSSLGARTWPQKKQSSMVNSNYITLLLILDGISVDYMDNSFLIDFFVLGASHNNLLPILVFEN